MYVTGFWPNFSCGTINKLSNGIICFDRADSSTKVCLPLACPSVHSFHTKSFPVPLIDGSLHPFLRASYFTGWWNIVHLYWNDVILLILMSEVSVNVIS